MGTIKAVLVMIDDLAAANLDILGAAIKNTANFTI